MIIRELVEEGFLLPQLLTYTQLSRSTYYYNLKQLNKSDKDKELKDIIKTIYNEHRGNYGYRRIH